MGEENELINNPFFNTSTKIYFIIKLFLIVQFF